MLRWLRNNWPLGAGILLGAGMILIFFLLMHPSERPYTGLTEAQGLQHGLAFQNTTALTIPG